MFIPISPGDDGSVPKRYQSMCLEHQVSTSAWSPDPRLPCILLSRSNFWVCICSEFTQMSPDKQLNLCALQNLSDDSDVLLLCSHHCFWDQTTSKAAQVSVSNLAQKRMRKRKERLNFFLFIFSVGKMLTLTNVHID